MRIYRRLSISTVIACFAAITLAIAIWASHKGLTDPIVLLNENQILYMFSTSAQVIAAIYGLTLTGFLFFRTELIRESLDDETITQFIDELKERFYWQLMVITSLVAMALVISNVVIAHESSKDDFTSIILINVGQAIYFVALASIMLFIFDVIYPNKVERVSRFVQEQLDPMREQDDKGSLEQFVGNYNRIQWKLEQASERYRTDYKLQSDYKNRKVSNIRLADYLLRNERISHSLYQKLKSLISLRNAIIHGAEPSVSLKIVQESEEIKNELERVLD